MNEHEISTPFETEEPYGLHADTARQLEEALESGDEAQIHQLLQHLHSADIADFISTTNTEHRRQLIEFIADSFDPEILVALDHTVRVAVVSLLGLEVTAAVITQLDTEDAVYVLEDLPELLQEELLAILPEANRNALQEAFAYPENSAGRLMQKKLVSVPEYWTVGQTIDYVRQNQALPDDFYEVFVVDAKHRPVGGVLISRIMRSQRSVSLNDIMEKDLKIIYTDLDQEEVSFIFRKYALAAAPVVNKDGRLVGVISVDDVVDVIEEEAEEDILRLGGITQTDIHAAFVQTAKHRFLWLLINLITAIIASRIIGVFEESIVSMVTLATLMPIVASMGGNAGTQTLTVMIRAIATKEVTPINAFRVVGKETLVGTLNGIGFAVLTNVLVLIWSHHNLHLSLVFGAAIVINLTVAGFAGAVIPLIFNRAGMDPAITSGVFLTTITDFVGFFSFLGLATLWLLA